MKLTLTQWNTIVKTLEEKHATIDNAANMLYEKLLEETPPDESFNEAHYTVYENLRSKAHELQQIIDEINSQPI